MLAFSNDYYGFIFRVTQSVELFCAYYGKRMMFMSVPFIIGIIIDIQYQGIGSWIAWGIWLIMFVLLLIDRHKRER